MRNAPRASVPQPFEYLRVGRHAHYLDFDGSVGASLQFGDSVVHARPIVGEPGVAERQHPVEDGRPGATDQDGRGWALGRFGGGPDAVEAAVAARVTGLVVCPDLLHCLDPLTHDRHPMTRISAVMAHLGA